MEQRDVTQRNIVDRYVLGQLSEDEQYEFEQYYFDHPEVLKEIALTEVMREALRAAPLPRAAQPAESWSQRLLAQIATPAWSLGATAAAVVLAGVLTIQTLQGPLVAGLRPQRPASVMPVVAELSLVHMRGQQGPPPIVHVKGPGVVSMAIDVAGMDPATLLARLRGPVQSIDLPTLTPDPGLGIATIVMPTQELAPGNYVLELRDDHGTNVTYKFEIAP